MIRAIIFDLGGVLFPENVHLVSERASKILGFGLASFAELQKEYSHTVMKGKMSFAEVLDLLRINAKLPFTLEEILFLWEKAYFEILKPNTELFNFVKKLKKNYKVALVSNIYDTTAKHHKKRGYLADFDPCILSCDVGMEKPNEDIFHLALEKLALRPEECIFIDDGESNCSAAKKLGFNSVQFTTNKKLFMDLRALGVVVK